MNVFTRYSYVLNKALSNRDKCAMPNIFLIDVLLLSRTYNNYTNDNRCHTLKLFLECPLVAYRMCDIFHISSAVCH